ncbi:phosphotransferase [soil metagenome]
MPDNLATELAAAQLALAAFGMPADAELTFIKYRENHVYRVRAKGLDRSLRMHRVGYRTDDELRSEIASIAQFHAGGISVPAPAVALDGGHVATFVDASGTRRQATMQAWIDDGREFGDSAAVFSGAERPSDQELHDLGALIARMHDVAAAGPPTAYARPAWDAAGLAGPTALWGTASLLPSLSVEDRALLDDADRRIAADLAALATTADRFGVIHADFTFENVLVTERGLVALDFDDSGPGWFLFDLTTPVFWCSPHPDADAMTAALNEGYRSVRPLPDEAGWHTLLLARALSYLGWAADRPGDTASDFHEEVMAPWVVSAARRYLDSGDTGWPPLNARTIENEVTH